MVKVIAPGLVAWIWACMRDQRWCVKFHRGLVDPRHYFAQCVLSVVADCLLVSEVSAKT